MSPNNRLLAEANHTRRLHVGDEVHLRGLIEISNFCGCNCLYCGLRRDNQNIHRYRMTPQEILEAVRPAVELGFGTIVLQGGEDPGLSPKVIARIIADLKSLDLAVTLSLGEWNYQVYHLWRQAGADRYLMRHETADAKLYAKLKPEKNLCDRLKSLTILRELGYQIGAGFMIGVPGNSDPNHKADIALLADLQPDMAGVGPFIPNPDTPFGKHKAPTMERSLSVLARVRLAIPDAHLPATTALETLYPQGRRQGLEAGANVIMPNLTPLRYRREYRLYPGKGGNGEGAENYQSILRLLNKLRRPVGKGPGHSLLWRKKEENQCPD